jgi:plastocyanin
MMGIAGVWLVLSLLLLLVVAGVAVALLTGTGSSGHGSERAHDILRRRLAAGEIDEAEFRERTELLSAARPREPSLRRWLAVALIALAVLMLAGLLAGSLGTSGGGWWGPMDRPMGRHMNGMMGQSTGDGSAPDAIPGADEIVVEAGDMWFDPAAIEVRAGEPVNLTVTNEGALFHDLTIDELDLVIGVDAGETATAGLRIDEPGEYEYYCSVRGHASAGMRGTLTVLPS